MDNEGVDGPQRVAVVIPCRDARNTIASTVRACRAIPAVDLIVVVDDGSNDETLQAARSAGAVAVRHSVQRGRASAMETGVKVAAMRDRSDWPPRLVLFLDQDLGDSAVEATGLVDAVLSGLADCAIGVPAKAVPSATLVSATKGVRRTTGWETSFALSTNRCLTREAVNATMPFSSGWGVDVGMTIDLLVEGYSLVEIVCNFHHLAKSQWKQQRRARYWDTWVAVRMRRLTRHRVPISRRIAASSQQVGKPYQMVSSGPVP